MLEGKVKAWRLRSGLGLAYRPVDENQVFGLTASRVGRPVGEDEETAVRLAILAVLRKQDVVTHVDFPLRPVFEEAEREGERVFLVRFRWRVVRVAL